MRKLYKKSTFKISVLVYSLIGLIFVTVTANAQSILVGSNTAEFLKNQQLLGSPLKNSLSAGTILFKDLDSANKNALEYYVGREIVNSNFLKHSSVSVLPFESRFRYNSNFSYGYNDGALLPSEGFQSLLSAGIATQIGPLQIQVKPEWLYVANPTMDSFGDNRSDVELGQYYYFFGSIDQPEQFQTKNLSKWFPGQSFIRLNLGPTSLGYSSENLKWGPGVQNSLILGNNAPGFQHGFVETNKPIKTYIGDFEAKILGGRLNGSEQSPLNITTNSTGRTLFLGYNKDWRYLFAMNINYQPKWVPNLFLGFTRTFMTYNQYVKDFGDYVPIFVRLQKLGGDQDSYPRDQRLSLYSKLLFPKAHAEVYFEYALNDNAHDIRDFIGSPDHGRAYLFGFSKLIPFRSGDQFISVNAEVTQLSQSTDRFVRDAGSFYQHFEMRQGYTHYGQTIGAGPGTGDNVQGLQIKWFNGMNSLGFLFQRIERNMDFYDDYVKDFNGLSRKWVDYGFGFTGQLNYKNFLLNGRIQGVQSLNYQWRMKNYDPSMTYYVPNNDVFNLHAELGISYRF